MPPSASVERATLGMSSGGTPGRRDSGSQRSPKGAASSTNGTLTRKTQPARRVDQHTAQDRSERKPKPRDRRPDTRRPRPHLRREDHGQQRQRRRHHARRSHAHQDPRRDQVAHRRGGRRQHRRDREAEEPQQEHPPAPEPVCEPVADEQQTGERDEECVEHPLQLADAGVEVVRHVRQRDIHDRHVHRADEHRDADDPQAPPALVFNPLLRQARRCEVDEVGSLDGRLSGGRAMTDA
jgi:hypothetical protein